MKYNELIEYINESKNEILKITNNLPNEQLYKLMILNMNKDLDEKLIHCITIDLEYSLKFFKYYEDLINLMISKNYCLKKIKKKINNKHNEFIELKDKKEYSKYSLFENKLMDYFLDDDVIQEYLNEVKLIDESDLNQINDFIKQKIELRINQKEALDRLNKEGIEDGIHCQATGCGKSLIILKYIDYCYKKFKNPKIILFTERISILKDFFDYNIKNKKIKVSKEKIKYWQENDIVDLSKFSIIERVLTKDKEWVDKIKKSKKPTLLVINRAFLTKDNLYKDFKKNDIKLILHDECHNTTSEQCYRFLKYMRKIKVNLVGFSATPLRTTNSKKNNTFEIKKLKEIYGNNSNLKILTDYNMIYAISNKLILPPEFVWYQFDQYKNNKSDNKELITQEELGSVLEVLDNYVKKLPYKKIIAWCGTIKLAYEWKKLFENNYKQRKNLRKFCFGIDTSKTENNDYYKFKEIDGSMILFCANKHREGSDIRNLDCCIFLDKVKTRSSVPFIQSIGRVLRTSGEEKTVGYVIDGFINTGLGYIDSVIEKIIGYYVSLNNVQDISESEKITNYDNYIKLKDAIVFDEVSETIKLKLKGKNIQIRCNKMEWNKLSGKFDKVLQKKLVLSAEDNMKHKGKILKEKFGFHKNTDFIKEYNKISKEDKLKYNLPELNKLQLAFKKLNWFDFCRIKHNFYSNQYKVLEVMEIKNISKIKKNEWHLLVKKDKRIPLYPKYIWEEFDIKLFLQIKKTVFV